MEKRPHEIIVKAALLPVRLYRRFISPLKPPCCRFYPTCSEYCLGALKKHGVIKGSLLTVGRILRCNPFCKGGFDPVPEKKEQASPLLKQYGFGFRKKTE